MAGTRSSSRLASSQPKSSPPQPKESPQAAAGSKRKSEAGSSPTAKRGRKAPNEKPQKTIEETMEIDQPGDAQDHSTQNGNGDVQPAQSASQSQDTESTEIENAKKQNQEKLPGTQGETQDTTSKDDEPKQLETHGTSSKDDKPEQSETSQNTNGDQAGAQTERNNERNKDGDVGHQTTSKMDDTGKIEPKENSQPEQQDSNESKPQSGDAVESHARDEETPASILEKGIIYFFIRGRVGIDSPSDVGDIARSYMVLRPLPHGAKITDGTIGDGGGKCRLLALPKKVLPLNGKDKFMTFVEKSKSTFKELRDEFMSGSDYDTKTAGVRHTPAVTPVAEGVYALTTTGRESHLAYIITIPQEMGEVQKDMGIREQGSFITSAKNPKYAGPANTNLPQGPDFPKEIIDEFRSLRWAPLQPKFLDYENAQFLLIGESSGLEGATEQQPDDKKADKETPKEELEKLEGEDEIRIKDLKGDDAVFADLGISKKEYSQVPTTWSD